MPPAAGYQNKLLSTNLQTGYGLDDSWACCNAGYRKRCLINYYFHENKGNDLQRSKTNYNG